MKSILVVDDSATIRQQLRATLASQPFEILEAENGVEGLTQADTNSVDLFIIDVNMPVMNGLDMLAELRKRPDHADTPVFVLTTESGRDTVERGKASGATAWIVKPFKPDILVKGVKKILGA